VVIATQTMTISALLVLILMALSIQLLEVVGKVIQPIGSSDDIGYSLAIQPDGKILLGGSCYNESNYDFCIARFNSNGTLDTSFGIKGKVILPIGSDSDFGDSLAIQPDGKILLGGYCLTSITQAIVDGSF
jgi:uncharacterized delta-60 repeat protein